MADESASPSPSMHTARDDSTTGGSSEVLGMSVEVPEANSNSNRVLNFDNSPNNDGERNSASTSTSTPMTPRSPQYLVTRPPSNAVLDMEAVKNEEEEVGDGDSVEDADESNVLMEGVMSVAKERLQVLVKLEDDTDDVALDNEANQVRFDLENLDPTTKVPMPPPD